MRLNLLITNFCKLLLLIILTIPAYAQQAFNYHAETAFTFSNGNYAPFWLTANRYGTANNDNKSAYIRAKIDWNHSWSHGWKINSGLDLLDDHVYQILNQTMENIYKEYQQDYRSDNKLIVAIGLHLEPALERLSKNEPVKNPLKEKIIKRHPTEFEYSQVLNQVVKQQLNLSFDDDELAFLALHFVVANNRID